MLTDIKHTRLNSLLENYLHYNGIIMGAIASQITNLTIVYSTVYSDADQLEKTSKLRVTGLCVWNSPGTGEFHAQMASNAENVSIWWRHHVVSCLHSQPGYCSPTPHPSHTNPNLPPPCILSNKHFSAFYYIFTFQIVLIFLIDANFWFLCLQITVESQKRINPIIMDIHNQLWIAIIQLWISIIQLWISIINYGYP